MKDKYGKRRIYKISYMDFYTTVDDDDGITIKSFRFECENYFLFILFCHILNFIFEASMSSRLQDIVNKRS